MIKPLATFLLDLAIIVFTLILAILTFDKYTIPTFDKYTTPTFDKYTISTFDIYTVPTFDNILYPLLIIYYTHF